MFIRKVKLQGKSLPSSQRDTSENLNLPEQKPPREGREDRVEETWTVNDEPLKVQGQA